jgi:hypothetical protein
MTKEQDQYISNSLKLTATFVSHRSKKYIRNKEYFGHQHIVNFLCDYCFVCLQQIAVANELIRYKRIRSLRTLRY